MICIFDGNCILLTSEPCIYQCPCIVQPCHFGDKVSTEINEPTHWIRERIQDDRVAFVCCNHFT